MSSNFGLPRFAKDSFYNLSRQGLSILIGLITSIIVARTLGVEARGVYAVVLLISTVLLVVFNSGIQVSVIYYIARAERDLTEMIQGNVALTTWISLLGIGMGSIIILLTHDVLFENISMPLLFFSLCILPVTMYKENLNSVFRGIQDFRSFNLVEITPQLGILLLTIVLVGLMRMGVAGAVAAIVGGRFMGLILALWFLRKRGLTHNFFSLQINWLYTRELIHYGKYVYISNISAILNYRMDTFLLTLLSTTRSVGIYDVAVTVVERIWWLSDALSMVMLPRIASLNRDDSQRRYLTPMVTRYLFWINLIVGILLSLLAEWFVLLIYGSDYQESAMAIRLLTPGIVAWGVATILAQDVSGRGEPRLNALAATSAAVLNFLVNLLLIPRLDYLGASITTTLSYTSYAMILGWSFCRLSGTNWRELVLPTREDGHRLTIAFRWSVAKLLHRVN